MRKRKKNDKKRLGRSFYCNEQQSGPPADKKNNGCRKRKVVGKKKKKLGEAVYRPEIWVSFRQGKRAKKIRGGFMGGSKGRRGTSTKRKEHRMGSCPQVER